MPLILDTPIGDDGEVKVVNADLQIESNKIVLTVEYGNTVAGSWAPGAGGRFNHDIADTDYVNMVTDTCSSRTNARIYVDVSESFYRWLVREDLYAGVSRRLQAKLTKIDARIAAQDVTLAKTAQEYPDGASDKLKEAIDGWNNQLVVDQNEAVLLRGELQLQRNALVG